MRLQVWAFQVLFRKHPFSDLHLSAGKLLPFCCSNTTVFQLYQPEKSTSKHSSAEHPPYSQNSCPQISLGFQLWLFRGFFFFYSNRKVLEKCVGNFCCCSLSSTHKTPTAIDSNILPHPWQPLPSGKSCTTFFVLSAYMQHVLTIQRKA